MRKIAIVGAGIAGLATALAIPASKFEVEVFEQAPEIKGVGSGLTLWPNATCVLNALGVLEECQARSGALKTLFIQLSDRRRVLTIPTGTFPTPAIAMQRRDLHQILMSKIKLQSISIGRQCLGVRKATEGSYLRFADGENGPYDLIVAADGIRSTLRSYVRKNLELRNKGYAISRGVADAADLFPADGNFFEIWGSGLRFGVLPMSQGQVCWYAARNQQAGDQRPLHEQKETLLKDLRDWKFPARELVARTALEYLIPSDVAVLKATRGWSRDRVLLLGDAIHPMAANLGLGGNMALEDALVLGNLLRKSDNIDEVCEDFENLRFSRVAAVTKSSNFIGYICQTENPIIRQGRNLACTLIPGRYFTWESRSLYSFRADQVAS